MTGPNSYRIRKESVDAAQELIDQNKFSDFSKVVNYAMVFYLDHIEKYGLRNISHIPREDLVPKVCRINEFVLQKLTDTGFFTKKEVPDYALKFYFDWLKSDRDSSD